MASLSHILASVPEVPAAVALSSPPPPPPPPPPTIAAPPFAAAAAADPGDTPMSASKGKPDRDDADPKPNEQGAPAPAYTSTSTSTRHNKSGNTSSVFSGNKIRHLKKEDGVPLWRKDIQYDFLRLVFRDTTPCFTKYSDGTKDHTFAAIYIDAMAKSSKCSKILREKLMADEEGATTMAMVCLLVNVGRMNTTLNFFPEMRAQLRTYHSIPALQAHQDVHAYKQLQDAPRLKSILKGATEDEPQPSTMEGVREAARPRTNPVNLLFVMSQFAPKVSEQHFPQPRDFFDLFMRTSLSSASRARAFLWLVWWYLESDFSAEDSQRNPFGPGEWGEDEDGTKDTLPIRVPHMESLTEEQANLENVDTEDEKQFGETKRRERIDVLASEPTPAMTALKRARKEKGLTGGHGLHGSDDEGSEAGWHKLPTSAIKSLAHETGSDYTRSPSPAASRGFQAVNIKTGGDMRINLLLNSDDIGVDSSPPHAPPPPAAVPVKKGPGRGNWRRNRQPKGETSASAIPRSSQESSSHHVPLLPNTLSFVSDGPPHLQAAHSLQYTPGQQVTSMSPGVGSGTNRDHVPTPSYQAQKRSRGVTQHQSAVINHRKQQIDYHLDRRIRRMHVRARDDRESQSAMVRAWKRLRMTTSDYDSEEEAVRMRKAKDRAEKRGEDDDDRRGGHRGGKDATAAGDDYADTHHSHHAPDQWRRPRVLSGGFVRAPGESNDVGEELRALAKTFRRAARRLERWDERDEPGQAVHHRLMRQQQGLLDARDHARRRPRSRAPTSRDDGDVESQPPAQQHQHQNQHQPPHAQPKHAAAARSRPSLKGQRQRSGAGRASERRDAAEATRSWAMTGGQHHDEEDDDDDDDGGGELDEEDRELLGEVDVDESEAEDEEMMNGWSTR